MRTTLIFMLLAAAVTLSGQTNTATVAGAVKDPSGAAVPEAAVIVTNTRTNVEYRSLTGPEGLYVVTNLPVGEYRVRVERQGFRSETRTGVQLAVDQRARVDFELQVGNVADSIQVTGEVPQVDIESSAVGQVIENKRVVELPLNGRNFVQLAALSPGTLVQGASQFTGQPSVLVNGNRGGATGFHMDGAENFERNAQTVQVSPPIEIVQEFKVQSSNFGADSGRQAAIVSVVTKSGTNEFHGNVFEFLRNRVFDARNFFSRETRAEDRKRNQFGGTLGGPIVRNRMFFFGGYEGTRQRLATVRNSLVPTQAQRLGDFSGGPVVFDPATTIRPNTRFPFAGNRIPLDRISRQAAGLLEYIPNPNAPADRYIVNQAGRLTNDQYNIKVDHRFTDKDSYSIRFTRDTRDESLPGPFELVGGDLQNVINYNAVASYTRTISPSKLNEFRWSTSRFHLDFDTLSRGKNIIDALGIGGLEGRKRENIEGFPILNVVGYGNFGDIGIRPLEQNFVTYNLSDMFTWIRGAHTIKIGADLRLYSRRAFNGINARGNFSFNGLLTQNPAQATGTGSSLADFVLGLPNSASRNFPRLRQIVEWTNLSSFLQDDWKVSKRLTLNIGIRHEYNGQPAEVRNRLGSFDLESGRPIASTGEDGRIDQDAFIFFNQTELDYLGVVSGISQGFPARSLRQNIYDSFAPRFGFSYDLFGRGRSVLRGGYGIFYTLVGGNLSTQNIGSVPFFRGETFVTDPIIPNLTLANAFPGSTAMPVPEIFAFQKRFENSYVQEWSFNIQHQLATSTVLEVGYVGSKGTRLDIAYPANQPRTPGPGGVQARRPFPRFSTIQFNTTEGNSNFHSLQVRMERRFRDGLTYLASYTLSKTIYAAVTDQNPYSIKEARALAAFDAPQRLVVSTVYEIPVGSGRRFVNRGGAVNALFGGWQVGGILSFQSGSPFTPTTGRDIANVGTTTRPDRLGTGTLENRTIERWFDASAFANPAPFNFGTSGVNILRGPGLQNIDGILSKSFRLGSNENRYVQYRFEAFNVLNRVNFANPNANINQPAQVGRIFAAGAPRILQMALKLYF